MIYVFVLEVMYLCDMGINFTPFYGFLINFGIVPVLC
jgi:hypothetical protein